MIVCDYLLFVVILRINATGERQGTVLRLACLRAHEPRSGRFPFVGGIGISRSRSCLRGANLSGGVMFGALEMI